MKISVFYRRLIILLKAIIKDPQRKNLLLISYEYCKFFLLNRDLSKQYFRNYFFRKGSTDFENYLLTPEKQAKIWNLNDTNTNILIDDKAMFEQYFCQHNIPVVKSLAQNKHSYFYLKDKIFQVLSMDEFINFLIRLKESKPNPKELIIKKSTNSFGGKDIFKIDLNKLDENKNEIESVFIKLLKSEYLFQPCIEQHELMSKIYPFSVNTIRIDTFTDINGKTEIISAFMRIGINGAYVDNVSKGGLFIGINLKTGELFEETISDIMLGLAKTFKAHPNTGFKLGGTKIPYFDEVKKLVVRAAKLIPRIRIVGWDVAIQSDGPVIIEGNGMPCLVFSELSQKGFKHKPAFRRLYDEIKYK